MAFHLGEKLAPKLEGEVDVRSYQYRYEVVFENLDGFLSDVFAVVVWWYELIRHTIFGDGLFVFLRDFVVQDV